MPRSITSIADDINAKVGELGDTFAAGHAQAAVDRTNEITALTDELRALDGPQVEIAHPPDPTVESNTNEPPSA